MQQARQITLTEVSTLAGGGGAALFTAQVLSETLGTIPALLAAPAAFVAGALLATTASTLTLAALYRLLCGNLDRELRGYPDAAR
ncbi:MAG: hypothetical protein ACYTGX_14875 [Planctomycetota bacterium]|jgi:hypothetical protein